MAFGDLTVLASGGLVRLEPLPPLLQGLSAACPLTGPLARPGGCLLERLQSSHACLHSQRQAHQLSSHCSAALQMWLSQHLCADCSCCQALHKQAEKLLPVVLMCQVRGQGQATKVRPTEL